MVKRQTVWLSTMMVLSLMLIGYYTMNSGAQTATTKTSGGPSVTTSTVSPQASNTTTGNAASSAGGTKTGTSGSQSGSTSGATTPTSGTDWFTNYQTQVEQNIAKKEGVAEQIIGSSSSSTAQINQAQQQLRQYMNLDGAMMQARQAILGEGYKNCVIVPNENPQGLTQVYVQTKKLTPTNAVKVMNIVSQQMNVPMNQIVVHEHA
ncbi:SpoIIIAH-like family protein [Alicyclobacillus sp. ALC3]|uniref:SpoIIIAH-like family protein n=1 Tax=Alicyclobacillus sp. ALC3 TaxID=2796143 RepID=UPI002378F88D|nr:SpoIIIAH-like family protein [Alicyclobacillus sp. ALC3]WDL97024.1 SpoIIIAH-like family protein [Alicyclobacillus sp. ALC3]